jgi:hypothetical protein
MGEIEICDVCGSTDIKAFTCKLICRNCGAILKTCSDLTGGAKSCGLRTNGIADC